MTDPPERVAIINAGEAFSSSRAHGDYEGFNQLLEEVLKEKGASVKTIADVDEAISWLSSTGGVMVFTTIGMAEEAKRVAKEHPRLKVVLFTGAMPRGEVVFVNKGWLNSGLSPEIFIL